MNRKQALEIVFKMAEHGAEDMAYYAEDYARGDDADETAIGYREALEAYNEARALLDKEEAWQA